MFVDVIWFTCHEGSTCFHLKCTKLASEVCCFIVKYSKSRIRMHAELC